MARPRASATESRRLDVAAVAAEGGSLEGVWPLASFERLGAADATEPDAGAEGDIGGEVPWRLDGVRVERAGAGRCPALRLRAQASVPAICQRCLQPMRVALDLDRRFVFVDGEDAAEALDALDLASDDDVLALPPALDVHALLEDELLLAMPLVPRHEVCPEPLPGTAGDAWLEGDPVEHPFAALADWKPGRPS